jgi:cytoskeleton protein RodZ
MVSFNCSQGVFMTGESLKKRREDQGLNVEGIAKLLKIKPEYLHAIEDDLFEELPVAVYTLGYVRTYAEYLELDPDPLVLYFAEHLPEQELRTHILLESTDKKSHALLYMSIGLIIVGFTYYLFFIPFGEQKGKTGRGQDTTHIGSNKSIDPDASPGDIQEVKDLPDVELKTKEDKRTESDTQGDAPEISRADRGGEEHVLVVNAEKVAWIRLQFESGYSEEILFQPGQSRRWAFAENVSMRIGNAGGIRLIFDGKDLGAPGKSGQVITVNLPESEESD